jgi:hypothetical protein
MHVHHVAPTTADGVDHMGHAVQALAAVSAL